MAIFKSSANSLVVSLPLWAVEGRMLHDLASERLSPVKRWVMVLGEQPAGDDGFPRFVQHGLGRWRFAVELQGAGCRLIGNRHRGSALRHRLPEVGRPATVAESAKQRTKPLPLPQDAVAGPPLSVEVPAKAKVLRREGAKFRPRCTSIGSLGLLPPAFKCALDVSREDLRQVKISAK